MTTNAPTIRRLPRLFRTAVAGAVAVIAIAAGYQAIDSLNDTDSRTQSAADPQPVTPAATLKTTDVAPNPFQNMSDPTPVVAAQIIASAATADPLQVTSDLTPVVSGHINDSVTTADPFEAMRDLTPVISAHPSNANPE